MGSTSTSMPVSPTKLRSDLYSYYNTHQDQESSGTPLVISVLASIIDRAMSRDEKRTSAKKCNSGAYRSSPSSKDQYARALQAFHGLEVPDMTIQSFLERIFRYTRAGPPVYVVAYVYIDRFCQSHPGFRISPCNVHRLLITTIMVASKYVEDMNYRNSYYARVGGLTTKELNRLEVDFLFMVGFRLHVNVTVFESYCCHLQRAVAIGGGYQIERTLRCCADEIKVNQCGVGGRFDHRIA